MKNRTISEIQAEAKRLRGIGKTWYQVADILKIHNRNKQPNPGLVYRIVKQNYNPMLMETRIRLSLEPICPVCKRRIGQHPHKRKKKSLMDYSDNDLRSMFENRQDFS